MQLISTLQNYGFSEKEAKVYLAALELGTAPASRIGRIAGEQRSTTYTVLQKLQSQGIATSIEKSGNSYFSVIDPETLNNNFKQKYEQFEKALPELMALTQKYDNRPKVQFFDGLEGVKSLYKSLITKGHEEQEGKPFLTFMGANEIDPSLQKFFVEEFIPRRLEHNTGTRAIIAKKNDERYTEYNSTLHENIIIDEPIFEMGNEIIVYGKKHVAIILYTKEEMAGFEIESESLHNALKNMFNLIRTYHKKLYPVQKNQ